MPSHEPLKDCRRLGRRRQGKGDPGGRPRGVSYQRKYLIICCLDLEIRREVNKEELLLSYRGIQFNCQRAHHNIGMSSPLSFNNPSALLGRQQSAVFWKRMRRPRRNDLDLKNAQQNPIYRLMRNRRQLSPISGHLNSKIEPNRLISNNPHFDHFDQLAPHQNYNKSHSVKQIETFKQKALKIVAGTKQFTADMKGSKRKVNILDKFNRKVEKYCSYLPQSPQDQTNESQHANDQLIQLCHHQFFPTEDLHKRVHSLIHYRQPYVNKPQRKELLQVSSLGKEEEKPKKWMQRMLTLNV